MVRLSSSSRQSSPQCNLRCLNGTYRPREFDRTIFFTIGVYCDQLGFKRILTAYSIRYNRPEYANLANHIRWYVACWKPCSWNQVIIFTFTFGCTICWRGKTYFLHNEALLPHAFPSRFSNVLALAGELGRLGIDFTAQKATWRVLSGPTPSTQFAVCWAPAWDGEDGQEASKWTQGIIIYTIFHTCPSCWRWLPIAYKRIVAKFAKLGNVGEWECCLFRKN